MRIAMVSPYDFSYPGGVTKHITNLTERFRRRGHQVWVITASSQRMKNLSPPVVPISSFVLPVPYSGSVARISISPWLACRVRGLLRRESFDVIHIHEPTTPTLPWIVAAQTRKVSPQTMLVGTFHSYRETPSIPYKYARFIFSRVVNLLDERIAVSPAARDYVDAYFPGSYTVIPNGVDVALFGNRNLPPLPQFPGGLNILFVGRLEPRKGFRYLMEAYTQVKTCFPPARLLVAGPYTAQEFLPFEQELQRRRLGDVHFVGYLSEEDLARYYQNSQILCVPSTGFESFGMVLLEAMAAGTPIVAFDIDGYRNLITHRAEGLLVKPKDTSALADALIYLLRSAELRQAMGRCGQATAARYTWDRVADQVLDCYDSVFERRREPGQAWDNQMARRGVTPYTDGVTFSREVG